MSRYDPQDRVDPGLESWSNNNSFSGDSSFTDPHEFYRLPTSPSHAPDIIIDPTMTSGSRQRQLHSNGVRTAPRPGFRSASGPASSSQSPAVRSSTSVPAATRPAVRHLVDRYNHSPTSSTPARYQRSTRASTGSRPPVSTKPVKAIKNSSPTSPTSPESAPNKLYKSRYRNSQKYPPVLGPSITVGGVSTGEAESSHDLAATVLRSPHRQAHQHPGRPALFGEINMGVDGSLGFSQAPAHPGEIVMPEGNMHRPNAMFPRGAHARTKSFQETSPNDLTDISIPSVSSHRKSRSEALNFTVFPYASPVEYNAPSSAINTPLRGQSPNSRIPIRKKRKSGISDSGSSASSRAGSSLSESRYTSSSPPKDSRLPLGPHSRAQAAKANGASARPKTPTTLSSKRYGGTPVTSPKGGTLQAVIRSPLPKSSPQLRTSRSRQPLSKASPVGSSKANVGELKIAGPAPSKSPVNGVKPTGLGGASFAARRKLFESSSQESLGKTHTLLNKRSGNLDSTQSTPASEKNHASETLGSMPQVKDFSLDTNVFPVSGEAEPSTASTEFADEESPVLGMPGQFPSATPPFVQTDSFEESKPQDHNADTQDGHQQEGRWEGERFYPVARHVPYIKAPADQTPHAHADEYSDRTADFPSSLVGIPDHLSFKHASYSSDFASDDDSYLHNATARSDVHSIPIMLRQTPALAEYDGGWAQTDGPSDSARGGTGATFLRDFDDESPVDPYALRSFQPQLRTRDVIDPVILPDGTIVDWTGWRTILSLWKFYADPAVVITADDANTSHQSMRKAISTDVAARIPWGRKKEAEKALGDFMGLVEDTRAVQEANKKMSIEPVDPYHRLDTLEDESPDPAYTGTATILEPQRYSKEGISRAPWEKRASDEHVTEQTSRTSPDHLVATGFAGEYAKQRRHNRQNYPPPVDPPPPPPTSHPQLPRIHATGGGLGLAIAVTGPKDKLSRAANDAPTVYRKPTAHSTRQKVMHESPLLPGGAEASPPHEAEHGDSAPQDGGLDIPRSKSPVSTPMVEDDKLLSPEPSHGAYPASVSEPDLAGPSIRASSPPPHAQIDLSKDKGKVPAESSDAPDQPELPSSSTAVITVDKDTPEGKRLLQRRNLVRELYDTEESYTQDLVILVEIYKDSAEMVVSKDDVKVLFSNAERIRDFADELTQALKEAVRPIYMPNVNNKVWSVGVESSPFHAEVLHLDQQRDSETKVGAVLEDFLTRMELLYGEYIKNHSSANERLLSLQNSKETQKSVASWMAICKEQSDDLTRAWNLDALLVKPTQRILKYPLILSGLLSCTPKTHPDYPHISNCHKQIIAMSTRINENSKRAELMAQVLQKQRKNEGRNNVSTALSRAFGRRKVALRENLGAGTSVEDKEYDTLAQRFGGHFFQVQIVMRDFEIYLVDTQSYMDDALVLMCSILDVSEIGHAGDAPRMPYPELESKWRKYAQVFKELEIVALPEHKTDVQKLILKPIRELWRLHDAPQNMIYKRKKNIPEYLRFKNMKDKGDKIDKKLVDAGETWEALNATLKDELPKLYSKTQTVIRALQVRFIGLQKDFQNIWVKKLATVVDFKPSGDFALDLASIDRAFKADYHYMPSEAECLGICNKSILNEVPNFLSPIPSYPSTSRSEDAGSSNRRGDRTKSVGSDRSVKSVLWAPPMASGAMSQSASERHAAIGGINVQGSASAVNLGQHSPQYFSTTGNSPRSTQYNRTSTGQSSGSITPRVPSTQDATLMPPPRPSTSTTRSENQQYSSRYSLESGEQRPATGSTYDTTQRSSNDRTSSIFSSALPMADSPALTRPDSPESTEQKDPEVLFIAASLFEFNIAHDRREGGYPYLVYVPGEVFDIVGAKGELWLARNQDDPDKKVGWIWEKHFARILPDTV